MFFFLICGSCVIKPAVHSQLSGLMDFLWAKLAFEITLSVQMSLLTCLVLTTWNIINAPLSICTHLTYKNIPYFLAGSKKFCKDTRTNRKTDKRDEGSVWLQSLGAPIDIFLYLWLLSQKDLPMDNSFRCGERLILEIGSPSDKEGILTRLNHEGKINFSATQKKTRTFVLLLS